MPAHSKLDSSRHYYITVNGAFDPSARPANTYICHPGEIHYSNAAKRQLATLKREPKTGYGPMPASGHPFYHQYDDNRRWVREFDLPDNGSVFKEMFEKAFRGMSTKEKPQRNECRFLRGFCTIGEIYGNPRGHGPTWGCSLCNTDIGPGYSRSNRQWRHVESYHILSHLFLCHPELCETLQSWAEVRSLLVKGPPPTYPTRQSNRKRGATAAGVDDEDVHRTTPHPIEENCADLQMTLPLRANMAQALPQLEQKYDSSTPQSLHLSPGFSPGMLGLPQVMSPLKLPPPNCLAGFTPVTPAQTAEPSSRTKPPPSALTPETQAALLSVLESPAGGDAVPAKNLRNAFEEEFEALPFDMLGEDVPVEDIEAIIASV